MFGISKLKFCCLLPISKYHTSKVILDKIIIPARIQRGPTDILKAIAGTIQQDTTRAAYQYHDDPFLTPVTKLEKKTFAFSKESGKKAARWVRDKHADLINHQPDDPIVKDFLPRPFMDEDAEDIEASEEILIRFIEHAQITNAIKVFKECNSEELSPTTLQRLLECVCYSNGQELDDLNSIDEFLMKESGIISYIKTWKDGGFAEGIFSLLKDTGSKPYCALIRGMCKFNQSERAWQLYQEALEKDLSLDSETISHIIAITPTLREDYLQRWQLVEEIILSMVKMQTPPSLSIMNSILSVLASSRTWHKSSEKCLEVLTEFRNLNIEPSLTSFYHILKTYHGPKRKPRTNILSNIVDYLGDQDISVRSPFDNCFFGTAMSICFKDLNDWELACRIHRLLQTGQNYTFIGNSFHHSTYYRSYLMLALQFLPMDEVIKIYDKYVPNIYIPDNNLMNELVKTIGVHDAIEHLPKAWSDILTLCPFVLTDHMFEMVLMIIHKHRLEDTTEPLKSRLSTIVWDVWNRMQHPDAKLHQKPEWTIGMLSDCLSILARCKEDSKVIIVLDFIEKISHFSLDDFPIYALEDLFHSAGQFDHFDTCYKCLLLLKEKEAPSFKDFSSKLSEMTTLTEAQLKKIEETKNV